MGARQARRVRGGKGAGQERAGVMSSSTLENIERLTPFGRDVPICKPNSKPRVYGAGGGSRVAPVWDCPLSRRPLSSGSADGDCRLHLNQFASLVKEAKVNLVHHSTSTCRPLNHTARPSHPPVRPGPKTLPASPRSAGRPGHPCWRRRSPSSCTSGPRHP